MPILDDDDLDEVDLLLIGLTEYLDELGISRTQQAIVAMERQQVAMIIVDQAYDWSGIDFSTSAIH